MWGSWRPSVLMLGSLALCACGPESATSEPVRLGEASSLLTVDEAVDAGCSTAQVAALSQQIVAQANCISPGTYEPLAPLPANASLSGTVLPFLQAPARDALVSALDAAPNRSMQINAMTRTVAQQYLLFRWFQQSRCGVGIVSSPGNSNHQNGLAVDVQPHIEWQSDLEALGFVWAGASDPVRFDYQGMGAADLMGVDVLAFQQLWNLNHPDDLIDADGIYGPQTEARVQQAPAEGFAVGPECGDPTDPPPPPGDIELTARFLDATDTYPDGPSEGAVDLVEGRRYQLEVSLRHVGQSAGEALTLELALPEGVALAAYALTRDGSGVEAPTEDETFGSPVDELSLSLEPLAPGERARLALEVQATDYTADRETPVTITAEVDGAGTQSVSLDVYSDRRFTFDGGRLEGWSGDVRIDSGALEVDGRATSPAMDLRWDAIEQIELTSTGSGTVALGFDGEAPSVTLGAADGTISSTDLEGAGSRLTSIQIDGSLRLDALAIVSSEALGGDPPTPEAPTDGGGCRVSRTGTTGPQPLAWLLGIVAALSAGRRRRD